MGLTIYQTVFYTSNYVTQIWKLDKKYSELSIAYSIKRKLILKVFHKKTVLNFLTQLKPSSDSLHF